MTRIDYLHLPAGAELPRLAVQPFRAVVVTETVVDAGWRTRAADWLVANCCLYAVCWGVECGAWEDAIDWAELDAANFEEIPDERSVMTTAHPDETLAEAMWFAGFCAFHPTVELGTTLLVHVSPEPRLAEMLDAYAKAQLDEG